MLHLQTLKMYCHGGFVPLICVSSCVVTDAKVANRVEQDLKTYAEVERLDVKPVESRLACFVF